MNILQKFEAKELEKRKALSKAIPLFAPGDTVKVNVKISEGDRERIQAYEGVCIARGGSGLNESFTVRKISYGEGVERVFPLMSPRIDSIEVVRRGSVRRAKLYYLRDRRGKSARITEKTTGYGMTDGQADVAEVAEGAAVEVSTKRANKKPSKKKAAAKA